MLNSAARTKDPALRIGLTLIIALLLLVLPIWLRRTSALAQPPLAIGDLLPRIHCPPGYVARVYAQGLRSPDGLAFSPTGLLHVAEESAGQVSRIAADGSSTPVLTGLDHPEGLAFDPMGSMYVVEDVPSGRLVRLDDRGSTTTLASGLEAPEGVAWAEGNTLYVTESSLQFYDSALNLRSRIARISFADDGFTQVTRVLTDTPSIDGLNVTFRSYAGIAAGADGRLYVTNELSGVAITRTVVVVPGQVTLTLTLSSTESVMVLDPAAGTRAPLTRGLIAPEGLRFALYGDVESPRFPLYVAEEGTGGEPGRLSVVGPDGAHVVLCSGFRTIEDVALDAQGRLYLSEDQDGMIVQITPARTAPETIEVSGPTIARIQQSTPVSAILRPLTVTLPITYRWQATGNDPQIAHAGLNATVAFAWDTPGLQWITVTASNAQGMVTGTHAITVVQNIYLPLILELNQGQKTGCCPSAHP